MTADDQVLLGRRPCPLIDNCLERLILLDPRRVCVLRPVVDVIGAGATGCVVVDEPNKSSLIPRAAGCFELYDEIHIGKLGVAGV